MICGVRTNFWGGPGGEVTPAPGVVGGTPDAVGATGCTPVWEGAMAGRTAAVIILGAETSTGAFGTTMTGAFVGALGAGVAAAGIMTATGAVAFGAMIGTVPAGCVA